MNIGSVFKVQDNSGIKYVKCIRLDVKKNKVIRLGDVLKVMPVKMSYAKKYNKRMYLAIVVGLKKKFTRPDGTSTKNGHNGVLMISENLKFMGTRVYGPICKEMRGGEKEEIYKPIISYSGKTF